MGCVSSKRVDATLVNDVYHPPFSSVAIFDINTIKEPWLAGINEEKQEEEEEDIEEIKKPVHVQLPILEKLESGNYDSAPQLSWSEVSKALKELKPSDLEPPKQVTSKKDQKPKPKLEPELDGVQIRPLPVASSLKENIFVKLDRMERENNKTGLPKIKWARPDPLKPYQEKPPPGNLEGVVLYTTSLRGVRRTFEDCEWARRIVYPNAVDAGLDVDERDVALHGEFLKEVRELVGEHESVPRLFIRGRYIGGINEMVDLNERGKMSEIMRWVGRKLGKEPKGGWVDCEGCGGARFVPCFDCSGSCKVVKGESKDVVRCDKCNENGLVMCPLCH